MRWWAAAVGLVAACAGAAPEQAWRPAWYAAPFPAVPVLVAGDQRRFEDQTVRQTMIVEAGGPAIRLRLTNELGRAPVGVAAVSVGRVGERPVAVRFARRPGAWLPAGVPMLSDAIALPVKRYDRLAVSVHYRRAVEPAAHLQPSEVAPGDQTGATTLTGAVAARAPGIVSAVEVASAAPVIVAIGDSITEGTPDQARAHRSWPQRLSTRLSGTIVVNAGVSGNRLLKDGAGASLLARLDRDALTLAGVSHAVLLVGINDIGNGERTGAPVTAGDIIAGYRQVIVRAHARGIRVIGATILPYRGAVYFTERGEGVRRAVNDWVLRSGAFDGVIDFARIVADPRDPSRLAAAYDPGDHLHPNDAGYAAMARAVPLRLLSAARSRE